MQKKTKVNSLDKLAAFLKKRDIYGHEIRLNYDGEETFRTAFGGIMTILTVIGVIALVISQLTVVFTKSHT
jgi:hypothetical protein